MSELTYKKIIDVETVEALNDGATVFVNDGGAMKQVGANKFGGVKTVNGVEPDENGDIRSDIAVPVLITHLKFPMFDDIKCNKTCEELHHSFLTQSTEATSIALCLYTALDKSEEYRYCTNFVLEKDNGEFTKRYFLYFGEDIAPYIIDVEANTITLDSDWVKPEENVQPDWNQNDETKPDYVKNRPYYRSAERVHANDVYGIVNFPYTLSVTYNQGLYGATEEELNELFYESGNVYEVLLNGERYLCEVKEDANEFQYIGATINDDWTVDFSEYPFVIHGKNLLFPNDGVYELDMFVHKQETIVSFGNVVKVAVVSDESGGFKLNANAMGKAVKAWENNACVLISTDPYNPIYATVTRVTADYIEAVFTASDEIYNRGVETRVYRYDRNNGRADIFTRGFIGEMYENGNSCPLLRINNQWYKVTVGTDGTLKAEVTT